MPEIKLVCPECGLDLKGLDPYAHALTHWVENLDPARSSKLAINRQKQTLAGGVSESEYIKSHSEEG